MLPISPVLMLVALAAPNDPSPTLDRLAVEAEKGQAEHPDIWRSYRDQSDRVFAENAKVVAGWRNRSSPPRPDLKPLGLPLAFLVAEARRLGEAPDAVGLHPMKRFPGGPALQFTGDRAGRIDAYLDAIAHHPDDRRIDALLEYRAAMARRWPGLGRHFLGPELIAGAATREWAAGQIRATAREAPRFDKYDPDANLPFRLALRFAGDLPPDVATTAYDYLRDQYPLGPHNGLGDRIWDVLLRLDPPRARREIIPYFHGPTGIGFKYNISVPTLLRKHAGPSPELAEAARGWLGRTDLDPGHRRDIRVILLRADPRKELKPAIEHVDRLISEQARRGEPFPYQGDVNYLLTALGEVGTKEADETLARYVFERTIPDTVRLLALESLAGRRYSGTPALVARWLAEESPIMQAQLRKKMAGWGDDGQIPLR